MKVEYYPQVDSAYKELRKFACAVLLPDSYNKARSEKYLWFLCVHGIGERSGGQLENLENLVLGFKQPDGSRAYAFVNDDMKRAVDLYGIVLAIPTYNDFFEPAKVNLIYDFILPAYNVTTRFDIDGFSYGAGAAVKYASSSVVNAKRLITCKPAAPTNNSVNWQFAVDQKLPIHLFVNDQDTNGPTNLSVTKSIVATINSLNPVIPAIYTAFRQSGHGGYNPMMGIASPTAPGGQGVIDVTENIYEHAIDVFKNGPRPMKTGSTVPPPGNLPIAKLTATVSGNLGTFDASSSTGVRPGWDAYKFNFAPVTGGWGFEKKSPYSATPVQTIGSLSAGTYNITLTVTGKDLTTGLDVTNTAHAVTISV